MKLIGFMLLIVLALLGIGITAPTIPLSRRKEETMEMKTEATETPADKIKQASFIKD